MYGLIISIPQGGIFLARKGLIRQTYLGNASCIASKTGNVVHFTASVSERNSFGVVLISILDENCSFTHIVSSDVAEVFFFSSKGILAVLVVFCNTTLASKNETFY